MKLAPLIQFVCDECGEIISTPESGWLEWLVAPIADERTLYGFRIVHHASASPRRANGGNCNYAPDLLAGDMHLEHFLSPDGLAKLLSLFDRPLRDKEELVEIIRRLHIPHYEEARLYWETAEQDGFFYGANEYWPYLQENLKMLIERYGAQ